MGASDLGAGPFRRPYELGRLTGLGLVSIYGLAYAIGEIAHFANPKKLVAYLGLNSASAKAEIGKAREFSNVMVAVPFVHCSGKPPRVCCRWKILRATGAWPSPCAAAETRPRLPWPASSSTRCEGAKRFRYSSCTTSTSPASPFWPPCEGTRGAIGSCVACA